MCDTGWSLFRDACYIASLTGQRKTWDQARLQCLQYGGKLAIVKTEEVRREINRLLDKQVALNPRVDKHAAVGMKKVGDWIWVNGQNVSENMVKSGDSFSANDCGALFQTDGMNGFKFAKRKCNIYGFFICESKESKF